MKFQCCTFSEFAMRIRHNHNKIVMFGAGVIGQITAPEIMLMYDVLQFVDCYIDNEEEKWGQIITSCGRKLPVRSPNYLNLCDSNTVILLNISRFSDVIKQLEKMECTNKMDCYIMPMMCIQNFCMQKSLGKAELSNEPMIPKKIHYMWLGKKEIPRQLQTCIDSWKRYCPDYEIIRWDEHNYDVDKSEYMRDAYKAGAYGFVPDYARIDILYHHGGIYMDTDVEVIKNLDPLLCQAAFCGVEKWQVVNFGGCSGGMKGHPMLKKFLDARAHIPFIEENGKQNRNTCGFYDTRIILQEGYQLNGRTQCIDGMNIYASDYFHPYDYMSGMVTCTEHTYSIHWFNGGWLNEKMKQTNKNTTSEYERLYKKCLTED